jgi:hypothetical protein
MISLVLHSSLNVNSLKYLSFDVLVGSNVDLLRYFSFGDVLAGITLQLKFRLTEMFFFCQCSRWYYVTIKMLTY